MSTDTREYLTIVSGLPRSGTSMMMRMLDEGGLPVLIDNIRVADEDNPKGYYEFEPVKKTKDDASWVAEGHGKAVKMVYRLLYDLPEGHEYRVLFMRRNLDEVIKSQDVMLERQGKKSGDLPADKLKDVFLGEIDKCKKWMDDRAHFSYIEVNYNDVLADPEPQVRRVHEFLDSSLDFAKMKGVVDQALYRQRK